MENKIDDEFDAAVSDLEQQTMPESQLEETTKNMAPSHFETLKKVVSAEDQRRNPNPLQYGHMTENEFRADVRKRFGFDPG